ncbi:MAG: hypothetical protein KBS81_07645 [Spirochaetales bacterium]|nr:hypothetical protein [Candidatus Physcosoma equi]
MNLKKERKKLVKEYRMLKERGEMRNFLPDSEEGVVHIPLKGDEESLFSSYNEAVPSSDAIEYLRESARALLPIQKAEIVLDSDCDIQAVEEKYKDFFAYSINRVEKEKRLYAVLSLVFLLLGSAIILSSYFFSKFDRTLVAETIDTIGCVLIWNAAEFWFIERRQYNKAQLDDLRLYATPWRRKN